MTERPDAASPACKCDEIHDALADGHPNPEGYMECADKDGHLPDCPLHDARVFERALHLRMAEVLRPILSDCASHEPLTDEALLRTAQELHENGIIANAAPPTTELKLRNALIGHRADLHGWSSRPCPTCLESAEVLGIAEMVPGCCARGDTDRDALNRLKGEG